ncbi:MAG: prepilin-type N-terminal cleavage/methylation domain-containing protein [Burkholderiaceae bacterium]|nr:prepilin-type N-terminal cleavage/methylation domain-containing protein [Burkholderiaceae bacterium]
MSEVGSSVNVAPPLVTACTALPPKGAPSPWDGPAANKSPLRCVYSAGFTLLELLVVVAIMAIASAGVSFAMRDSSQTQLEREAQRLAALLESARAQSRSSGVPVRWRVTEQGFVFEGLPADTLPHNWIAPGIVALGSGDAAAGPASLQLGPEPIIGKQSVTLSAGASGRTLRIATDGLRPFAVEPLEPAS